MTAAVTRWVVSVPSPFKGYRILAHPAQGRHTYATKEEAEQWISAYRKQGRTEILGNDLQATGWPCYPDHFDPISIYQRSKQ